jgi:hypothetical protein
VSRNPWASSVRSLVTALLLVCAVACAPQDTTGGFPDARGGIDGGSDGSQFSTDASGCPIAAGGHCEGSTLTFCEGGQVMTFNCAEQDLPCRCRAGNCGCGADGSPDGGTAPTPDAGPVNSCGSVTAAGACSSSTVVVWCEGTTLASYDCAFSAAWCECDGIGCGCCDYYGCF